MTETNPIPSTFYRISIKALVLDQSGRFLLTKEDNGNWELPGGGLEFGEKPEECLRREIKEEMGLEVEWVDDKPSYIPKQPN
jgi:8-oxo-dGTP pyrophosphatase MutT (NUDIX family)